MSDSHLPVFVAAGLATLTCVAIHYAALQRLLTVMRGPRFQSLSMVGLPASVLALLVVHLVEIAVFAGAYLALPWMFGEGVGRLVGPYESGMPDAGYFSAAVYTTVGFGDITAEGPLRTLVAVEALVGLVMVTWSASFTFLAMQRLLAPETDGSARRTPAGPA